MVAGMNLRRFSLTAAFAALSIGLLVGASPSPVAIPDTPAGRIATGWLTAFNSDDRTQMKAFLQNHEPANVGHLDDDMDFRSMTGGFDVVEVEQSTPTQIVLLVEDRLNEQYARMKVALPSSSATTIAGVDLEAIDTPAKYEPAPMTQSALIDALTAKLAYDASAGIFSGAVLVAKNGTPVFQQAYGLADRAKNEPNTLQTRFRIGSMNKMFTATAVMQLVQAGKIRLDAPLAKYLPHYPNKTVSSQVTISELLTHTGGTGDIFGPVFDQHRLQLRTLEDYEKFYGTRGLEFKPGSKWSYSNYGFILLGLVIQKVTGESYYDYVDQHIFKAAGMTSTASEPEDVAVTGRSIGYMRGPDGKLQPNTATLPYRGSSAGGGYSTVGDFLRFAGALTANKLLDPKYTALLTTGKVKTPGGLYAFGFDDVTINGVRCFGHNGGAPGMNGDLKICPASGYTIVALANIDPPAAGRIADWIAKRQPRQQRSY
jgi:D-alanyl-D-alanine carboxypeptidase